MSKSESEMDLVELSAQLRQRFKWVALVHDWLIARRGGEKVLEGFAELFPHATLHTLLYRPGISSPLFDRMEVRTSILQDLPAIERYYRRLLPLFPAVVESIDLSGFDLVISSSHCAVKGVISDPDSIHICYCYTPMRYAWDRYDDYFGAGRAGPAVRLAARLFMGAVRKWDASTASRVDRFYTSSKTVARRIRQHYGRTASVIHPPVDTEFYTPAGSPGDYYLAVSALVPYKMIDVAVRAFRGSARKLIVAGAGPEEKRLRDIAGPEVDFVGAVSDEELRDLYRGCRALVFPGVEDFGIIPLEAQACGRPVIALGEGGVTETVIDGRTGVFYNSPTAEALRGAVDKMETMSFNSGQLRENSLRFSRRNFREHLAITFQELTRGYIC